MLLSQRDMAFECKLNTALVDIVFTQLWDDLCESLEHGFCTHCVAYLPHLIAYRVYFAQISL